MIKHLRPWNPKPYKPIEGTVLERSRHHQHDLGNRIMVLSLRMELKKMARAGRLAAIRERRQ